MRFAHALAAGAVAYLFAGCAAWSPGLQVPPAAPFDILGRVLVSYDGRAFSSGFRWRHDEYSDEIWLMTPVGQTLAHIAAEPGSATLTGADQMTYQASSVESLTRRALGWSLPLAQLQHWIGGNAVPGVESGVAARDTAGRLTSLDQHGWQIRYVRDAANPVQRTRRLDLAQGTQQIRMIIDEWRGDSRSGNE